MTTLNVTILGAGATGGLLAALLADSGTRLTLVARGASRAAIAREGISVTRADGSLLAARPAAVIGPDEAPPAPADLLFFCVKAYDTRGAIAALPRLLAPAGRVLCLQNGVENETLLAEALGAERVMAGVMYVGAERTAPGAIRVSTPVRTVFGATHPANEALVEPVRAMLAAAGIAVTVEPEVLAAKWQKFLFNIMLNPLTALTMRRMGAIFADAGGQAVALALLDEAIAAGRAAGAPLRAEARAEAIATARRMDISSSLAEDLQAGRPIELDLFTGFVRRLGAAHGVATPMTDTIHALLALRAGAASAAGGAHP
ncbi:MAG: 2-dehydropantoate 2-reductase [Alphaproteobacteria bacterium]|nr:2-dehydropantoate 2-reductase [Alphaproteobacteria bacterium]